MEAITPPLIFRLPDEIIVRTLHLCSYRTILRFAGICRQYRALVSNTASVQLHVELDASGMEIQRGKSPSSEGYESMLSDIRSYRESWQNLKLETTFQKTHYTTSGPWTIHNGIFVKGLSSDFTFGSGADSLLILPLHLTSHPSPLHFNFTFNAVEVDLSQELAVLVGFDRYADDFTSSRARVNLVSSVTGDPHPAASLTTFSVTLEEFELKFGVRNPSFAIMREILLISFSDTRTERYTIFTWNWQAGNLLHVISDTGILYGTSFLDQGHLAVLVGTSTPRVQKLCLLVYAIHSTSLERPANPDASTTSVTSITPTLQLDFPRLRRNISISPDPSGANILVQPDFIPGRPIQIGSTAFSYPRIPILGMKLTLLETLPGGTSIVQRFHIFACVDHLLRLVQNRRPDQAVLPWSEWGIMGTRWLREEYLRDGSFDRFSHMGISGPRHVQVFEHRLGSQDGDNDTGDEDDEDEKEGGESGASEGDEDWEDDEGVEDVEYGLFSIVDFNPSEWRHNSGAIQVMGTENRNLVRCGYRPSLKGISTDGTTAPEATYSDSRGLGAHANIQPSETVPTIIVGSDTPTILGRRDGFDEPVESRLPYRLTGRVRPVPPGSCWPWIMKHDSVIGLNVRNSTSGAIALGIYRIYACIY
ncbi:unnamed protein product [Rhizoctonia solani]|uniref:F-box domain-containing protein n=1 Tax=Rhizoctonia solani TaxID=456999 RepID=A0A8H2XBP0_9AGAM|nr:unnamed protein product [Rhizoctonia solani]